MTLYSYDHCPYCVKARMIFGLKNTPMKLVTLLNDDEKTPISMVGKKILPILEKTDGTFMAESLDIVSYIDAKSDLGEAMVKPSLEKPELTQWLSEIRQYHYALAMPRWVKMGLPEFVTEEAVQYFTRKKEDYLGPFDESIKRTQELIQKAHAHLPELEKLLVGQPFFWGEQLTADDFHVFASLRCLTTTKGLVFPERLNNYMNFMSEKSQVPLHWELALGESF